MDVDVIDGDGADDEDVASHPRGRGLARGRAGRGRGLGGGRVKGYIWNEKQRSNRHASNLKKGITQLQAHNQILTTTIAPSVQKFVSSEIFGTAAQKVLGRDQRQ